MKIISDLIKRKAGLIVFLTCFILFLSSFFYFNEKYKSTSTDDYIGRNEGHLTDLLDYHFIATNFALTGQFPVTGYLLDTSVYKIHSTNELNLIYLDVYKANGAVTTFIRPPLYPLLVGCIYKFFGYKIYYNQRLNILLLALIIGFMPLVGFKVWGKKGFFSGIGGAMLFMKYGSNNFLVYTMDLEVFTTFVFFIISSITLVIKISDKSFYYLFFGISIGIGVLTKSAAIVFFPFLFSIYFLIRYSRLFPRQVFIRLLTLLIGITLVVLPYTIYINYKQTASQKQREEWIRRVSAGMKKIEVSSREEIINCESNNQLCSDLMIYFAKSMYTWQSRTSNFLIITNATGEALLHANNEYCLDGKPVHAEWMFIKTSFYRTHDQGQSPIMKFFSFYRQYPSYIFKIPIARLIYACKFYPLFYWLAGALWGLCIIQRRISEIETGTRKQLLMVPIFLIALMSYASCFIFFKYASVVIFSPLIAIGVILFKSKYEQKISFAYPLLWLCPFLFIMLVYSGERFTRMAEPISCLCVVYFTLLLGSEFVSSFFGPNEIKRKYI